MLKDTLDGKDADALGDVFGVSSLLVFAGLTTVFGQAGSQET